MEIQKYITKTKRRDTMIRLDRNELVDLKDVTIKTNLPVEYSGRDFTLKPDFGSNHSGITFQ